MPLMLLHPSLGGSTAADRLTYLSTLQQLHHNKKTTTLSIKTEADK